MFTRRTLTQADFDRFARLSGDDNPIHVNPDFSASTRFGRTVSHGMLLFTVARGLISRQFPEYRLVSQSLKFPAPCFADEELECRLEVADRDSIPAVVLVQIRQLSDDSVVLEGQALLTPEQQL